MPIKPYISVQKDYIVGLRRHFHEFPELSLHEFATAKKIEDELDAFGIEHRRVGETGVAAFIRGSAGGPGGGKGAVVALRADIDALPIGEKNETSYRSRNDGVMHACGHDAHTASLLGAARVLKERESEITGEIRLFFQQAEEVGQGARQFVSAGLLDGVDVVLGTHVSSYIDAGSIALPAGSTNASCDFFRITVRGSSAHVSTPQLGTDAVYIASKIVVELQSIVARHTNPLDSVVVGVGVIRGGTAYNIIANEVVIEGTTRSFSKEIRERTNGSVAKIAALAAEAEGGSAEVHFESFAAPLVNDEAVAARARIIAAGFINNEKIIATIPRSLGADDFADYLEKVPGAYAFIGTRNALQPSTAKPLHNELFDIDEDALLLAANLYVDFALDCAGKAK